MAIANPPILGIGWPCTFRQSGTSSACTRPANRLKTGISAMVIKMERRKVESRIIERKVLSVQYRKVRKVF
jgi:hypothetical protein